MPQERKKTIHQECVRAWVEKRAQMPKEKEKENRIRNQIKGKSEYIYKKYIKYNSKFDKQK